MTEPQIETQGAQGSQATAQPEAQRATQPMPQVAEQVAAEGAGQPAAEGAGQPAAKQPARPKKPAEGKAAKRRRTARLHRGVRWAVQIAFFAACPAAFSAAFNGVKYIFQQIGAGDAVTLNSFVVVMLSLFAFTMLFGRFFCGYACAFGTLGDAMYALFTPVRRTLHIPDAPLPAKVQRALQATKYAVLVAICVLCFLGVWAQVSGFSPWTAFAGAVAFSIDGIAGAAFAVLFALMLGMALVERFFCQFLCPLGACFSLLPQLPFSAFSRDRGRCLKRCDRCQKGCPVNIHPDVDEWYAGECIACGRCADACPLENVNLIDVKSGDDVAHLARKSMFRVRGSEPWVVLVKAALLLALFWALGMVDFLPTFAELFPNLALS